MSERHRLDPQEEHEAHQRLLDKEHRDEVALDKAERHTPAPHVEHYSALDNLKFELRQKFTHDIDLAINRAFVEGQRVGYQKRADEERRAA